MYIMCVFVDMTVDTIMITMDITMDVTMDIIIINNEHNRYNIGYNLI